MAYRRQTIAVYAIANTVTGRRYVGATRDLDTRLQAHRAAFRRGANRPVDMQADWDRYGPDAFAFETLEVFPSLGGVRESEDRWIAEATRTGGAYNRSPWSTFHSRWFGVEPGREWGAAAATTAGTEPAT